MRSAHRSACAQLPCATCTRRSAAAGFRGDCGHVWHARHILARRAAPRWPVRAKSGHGSTGKEGRTAAVRGQPQMDCARCCARDVGRLRGGRLFHRVQARRGRVREGGGQANAARGLRAHRDWCARAARAAQGAPARAVPQLPPRLRGAAGGMLGPGMRPSAKVAGHSWRDGARGPAREPWRARARVLEAPALQQRRRGLQGRRRGRPQDPATPGSVTQPRPPCLLCPILARSVLVRA